MHIANIELPEDHQCALELLSLSLSLSLSLCLCLELGHTHSPTAYRFQEGGTEGGKWGTEDRRLLMAGSGRAGPGRAGTERNGRRPTAAVIEAGQLGRVGCSRR